MALAAVDLGVVPLDFDCVPPDRFNNQFDVVCKHLRLTVAGMRVGRHSRTAVSTAVSMDSRRSFAYRSELSLLKMVAVRKSTSDKDSCTEGLSPYRYLSMGSLLRSYMFLFSQTPEMEPNNFCKHKPM